MVHDLWRWLWADLGSDPPSARQALLGLLAAVALSLILWGLVVAGTL
jgi:hypothetical protein